MASKPLVIGFGHKARQGKNSAAVAMINAAPIGSRARIYAYADALRAEVRLAVNEAGSLEELVANGFLDDNREHVIHTPDWVKAETGKPRTLLQWWGTDYRRAQDKDYWVKRLEETLEREGAEIALITDVRFENEADAIHKAGGKIVKVTRLTPPDIDVPAHPSEDELNGYAGWDFEIKAETMADLRKQAAAIYRQITEGKQ